MSLLHDAVRVGSLTVLSRFRTDFYDCLTARADALFELADAVLRMDGALARASRAGARAPPGSWLSLREWVPEPPHDNRLSGRCTEPTTPGPGRPPGSKNRRPAPRHDVGRVLAGGLSDPNIVTVHDFGSAVFNRRRHAYLVM